MKGTYGQLLTENCDFSVGLHESPDTIQFS